MENSKALIYDWNQGAKPNPRERAPVELDDETLRDGLQCPSVKAPAVKHQKEFLHLLASLGVNAVDIGLPATGTAQRANTLALAREVARARLPLSLNCAARTKLEDVRIVVDISQKAGIQIEVATFIGSSPIRQFAEGWDIGFIEKAARKAISEAVRNGLPAMFVTEDTTRTRPEVLRRLCLSAIESGARRLCIADTVGFATPRGAERVVSFLKKVIAESGEKVSLDWHGHQDRGLGVASALAAWDAGADRLHGAFLGLGERSGNTPLDLLLVNLKIDGAIKGDISGLASCVEKVAKWMGVEIPFSYPVFGKDAYRTSTGIHASAMLKALKKGDHEVSELVYSAAVPGWFGRSHSVEIGPMSGSSNVVYWLESRGVEPSDALVAAVLSRAKRSSSTLRDEDIHEIIKAHGPAKPRPKAKR
ncbi:MAG: 2-isopropylmalate synthase [Acidobacteria bacterium]|nr:2-isopropylmalate synthase [Acidobacteriota bacterium]